jgi:hypothetical protein
MNIEILHHFLCPNCSGWWSIATEYFLKARSWYCPWCGLHDFFEVEKDGEHSMGGRIPTEKDK